MSLYGSVVHAGASEERRNLIVLTDIGGDPDDMQSMRRLLLYANCFEIKGLIASASGTPNELKELRTRPDLIREIIDDYEAVRPMLSEHESGYPTGEYLKSVIASGDVKRTVDAIVPGAHSSGSRLIESVVDSGDPPVYVAIWGGARDLAQALCDARAERSSEELEAFIGKLRVYAIGDQDGYNTVVNGKPVDVAGTGKWIKENFPNLRYVETNPPERDRYASLFRGMYQNDSKGGSYALTPLVRDGLESLNQVEWLDENVRLHHGPLGEGYPLVHQNPGSERNTKGVKEGDTPSWFFLLPNGLSFPEEPTWGGWGGRFELNKNNHYIDAGDDHWYPEANDATRIKWTVARWREAYQNDFAARMDWCVKGFEEANHAPQLKVAGDATTDWLKVDLEPGKNFRLRVEAEDPDGDGFDVNYWIYQEVTGEDAKGLRLKRASEAGVTLQAPRAAAGKRYHLIVEAKDWGEPRLSAYRRVLVEVAER